MIHRDINPIIQKDLDYISTSSFDWSELSGKSLLITGGGGLLASYLVKALITASQLYDLRLKIICLSRGMPSINKRLRSFIDYPDLDIVLHDISQPLPSSMPLVDYIIHSASQASPRFYNVDPVGTILPNTAGTLYLLQHATLNNARFLFFSSAEVYGNYINSRQVISESVFGTVDPLNIRSCYAESKRLGETLCASWHRQYGLHTTIVRPFHTYGPGVSLDDGRVFADFVADVVNKKNITLKSNGLGRRVFCYISDATLAFLTVLLRGHPGEAYNVANPNAEISMRDLAYMLSSLHPDRQVDVDFENPQHKIPPTSSSLTSLVPSIDKISKLGWYPKVDIENGFLRTINSFLLHSSK